MLTILIMTIIFLFKSKANIQASVHVSSSLASGADPFERQQNSDRRPEDVSDGPDRDVVVGTMTSIA